MNIRLAGQKTKQLALITLLMLISYCCTIAQDKKVVYITKTGEKYHTENCHYLKYSKTEIELDKAKDRGYMPCSVCKPGSDAMPKDTSNDNGTNRSVPAAPAQRTGTTTTQRCSATTQAGSQCKRTTSDSSGKCWQHQ